LLVENLDNISLKLGTGNAPIAINS
jgi:hypothetical protein